MDSFLPLIFISVLLLIQFKMYKNLCLYLSKTYPQQWQKLASNKLGGSERSAVNANLNESLKSGYFATITDAKIERFKKVKLFNLTLMALIVFVQLLLAFLQ